MANTDTFSQSRTLFPEMLSFSIDPEVLTFLWGVCANKAEEYKAFIPSSQILQIFVPYEDSPPGFITYVKYTVVTGFITMCVGASSYLTFKCLKRLKSFTFTTNVSTNNNENSCPTFHSSDPHVKLKKFVEDILNQVMEKVRRPPGESSSSLSEEERLSDSLVLKKPSQLPLPGNGVPRQIRAPEESALYIHSNTSPRREEIASGEERFDEVYGDYFGPVETPTPTPDPDLESNRMSSMKLVSMSPMNEKET